MIDALKKQLETAQKKIAFYKEKQLTGGLSLDQEFALEQDLIVLETTVAELNKKISLAYGLNTSTGQSVLIEKINQLNITEDIGDIHLVNCNREIVADSFWEAFDLKLESEVPFQFYFIPACPTQQPNSFTERMVIEIILDELDEEEDAILCLRDNKNRIILEDLPFARNFVRSQKAFAKYFASRFELGESTMQAYLDTGLPKLEYDYIATVFEIFGDKWKDFSAEYLDWIITQFKATHDEVPTFLFFFVVYLKDIHTDNVKEEYENIKIKLREIQIKHLEIATLLQNLKPVPRDLLESWVRDLGEGNQSKIEEVVDAVIAGLKTEARQQYDANRTLNMSDVERFQELVYEVANK